MVVDPEEDTEAHENIAEDYSLSYYAIKCERIAAPMSTRVIKSDEGERILMCGTVVYGGRCLENLFLGIIQDNKNRMVIDVAHPPGPLGFLVEIALLRRKRLPKRPLFMQVVKFHGNAKENVNCVPLKDSYVPVSEPAATTRTLEARMEKQPLIIDVTDSGDPHEQVAGPSSPSPASLTDNNTVSIETLYLEDDRVWFNISVEDLLYYEPSIDEKMNKSLGLVVKKQDNWALVYSKRFGIGLLRAVDCKSAEDRQLFGKNCNPGDWIGVNYIKAVENMRNKFNYMCFPKIEPKEGVLPTKVEDNIVQVCNNLGA